MLGNREIRIDSGSIDRELPECYLMKCSLEGGCVAGIIEYFDLLIVS